MREALRLLLEEGLEARWTRHALHGEALRAGLKAMGLSLLTQSGYELAVLTAVLLPEGTNDLILRKTLLKDYNIEIGGGLGKHQRRLIRIGLMGYNSSQQNVITILSALEHVLPHSGFTTRAGAALAAVDAVYQQRG